MVHVSDLVCTYVCLLFLLFIGFAVGCPTSGRAPLTVRDPISVTSSSHNLQRTTNMLPKLEKGKTIPLHSTHMDKTVEV
jgi:hypothetical protein